MYRRDSFCASVNVKYVKKTLLYALIKAALEEMVGWVQDDHHHYIVENIFSKVDANAFCLQLFK